MESTVRLELNGFMRNAGILGFVRLLNFLGAKEGSEDAEGEEDYDYLLKEDALCINREYLTQVNLARGFIDYANQVFYDHSIVSQWDREFSILHAETKKYLADLEGAKTEEGLLNCYQEMNRNELGFKGSKNIEKAYVYLKKTYEVDVEAAFNSVMEAKDIEAKHESLIKLEEILKREEIRRHFLIVSIADRILSRFWIKAFLATSTGIVYVKSGENMELQFHKNCTENLENYLKEPDTFDSKGKRVCAECGCDHVQANAPTLSFLNDVVDDVKRKSSAFWDLDKGMASLCEVCAFNYLLIPFGFTMIGHGKSMKALFINDNTSLKTLYRANKLSELKESYLTNQGFGFYNQLVQTYSKANATRQLHNIQLITRIMDKESQRYQFNILSYHVLYLLCRTETSLRALSKSFTFVLNERDFNPYEQAIFNLLNHQHQYRLIQTLCRLGIDQTWSSRVNYALRHLWVIHKETRLLQQELQEGGLLMSIKDYELYIEQALSDGRKLSAIFFSEGKDKTGVICRLLNAVQSNNRNLFLQTIIRLHSVNGKTLSKGFVEALSNDELFNDMAHAYLLGFQGVYVNKNVEGDLENETI